MLEWVLSCARLQLWAEQGPRGRGPVLYAPRKRGWVFEAPRKPQSVTQSALPTRQHHKPRELQLQSTKQPGSGQLAGPVGRAGLTIAARDSRRAFGAVGLYVWRDLGSC